MADTATAPTDKASAIDWSSISSEPVPQLKVSKTVDSIPAPIRAVVDASLTGDNVQRAVMPSTIAARVFAREAKEYGYLHDPRLTVRCVPEPDGLAVRIKATVYTAPVK